MTRKYQFAAPPWLLLALPRPTWPDPKHRAAFLRIGHFDSPASMSIFRASAAQTSVAGRQAVEVVEPASFLKNTGRTRS